MSPTSCLSKKNARGLRTAVMTACTVSPPIQGSQRRLQWALARQKWQSLQRTCSVTQVEDPWASEFLKYREMGFSREEVAMALGALGSDADQGNQVRLAGCSHAHH